MPVEIGPPVPPRDVAEAPLITARPVRPRSEKLGSANGDDEQQAFVCEETQTGIATIKTQVSKGREEAKGKRAPRRRKGFAPHLERIKRV
ncbi:hypothetical protein ACVIHH_008245 [Bradyrhizobium sp. USDA 4518]